MFELKAIFIINTEEKKKPLQDGKCSKKLIKVQVLQVLDLIIGC